MLGRILCGLVGHSWYSRQVWRPRFGAPIVTGVEFISRCRRCGKSDSVAFHYDPETGEPIREVTSSC
jgi:hypothetical protein